ncbi:hypothetical protein [Staphylococcus shinii]
MKWTIENIQLEIENVDFSSSEKQERLAELQSCKNELKQLRMKQ